MEFFTNLGRKLDTGFVNLLSKFRVVVDPPAPDLAPPVPQVMYPDVIVKLCGEEMQAKLIRREFSSPIHDRVDITNDEEMTAALNKAGYAAWDPRFRLI